MSPRTTRSPTSSRLLNPEKRGDKLESDAATMLAGLKQGGAEADIHTLGDSTLLPREFNGESQRGVESQFGHTSGYGLHLVLLTQRAEGRFPELGEVREQVKRELLNARRREASQRILDNLLAKYQVTIEWPKDESKPTAKTTAMNQ